MLLNPVEAAAAYRIDVWNTDNGLPQNSVYSIVQTHDGYLWLTTLDGLVRHDGAHFKVFNRSNTKGLNTNRLVELAKDSEGNLWILTEAREIIRYRDGLFTPCSADRGWPPGQHVQQMLTDNQGTLLFVTIGGIFSWQNGQFVPRLAGDFLGVLVHFDREGALWRIGKGLVHRLKDGNSTVYRIGNPASPPLVTGIYEDRNGTIWVGTRGAGLFRFQNEQLTSYTVKDGLPDNIVGPSCEDRKGNLWLATNGGVCILSNGKFTTISSAQGLSSNLVAGVYEDHEGTIWIGTVNAGLNRITQQSVSFYSKKDGLSSNNVYPICEDREGRIWLGGDGFTLYEGGVFTARNPKGRSGQSAVTALHLGRDGRLWIGRSRSLLYFKDGKFVDFFEEIGFSIAHHHVNAIHEDSSGNLWVGAGPLFSFRNGTATLYTAKDGYSGGEVRAFLEDRAGDLWIATYGGLFRFDGASFVSFTESDGLSSNNVRSLFEDGDRTLWIGTYDGGLNRLKDGKFTRCGMDDGLFNDGVFQILEDSLGNFWMTSNRGIYRTSKQQLNDFADGRIKKITCVSYGSRDGLLNTECNGGQHPAGIRTHDGRLWLPTQGGVAVIDPEGISFNIQPPPVVIQSCRIDGESVDFQNGIEIAPSAENLEISYAGLSFIKPEMVSFKYRLMGIDSDWIDVGTRRIAYYSHIPPGSYTFEVLAANADGARNTVGAKIRVRVIPAFWQTWWFSALVALGVAALGGLLYEYRVSRLRKAKAAQEGFSRRLIESQEQERKRIAAELHDSLGQNLLIIKNRALIALTEAETMDDARDQLDQISSMSSQALDEVRQISYNLRPYQIDRLGLTKAIRSMLRKVGDSSGVVFAVDMDPIEGLFSKESEISLYRVVQESVNNIVKHSEASQARVSIKRDARTLHICIEDNGMGFKPEAITGKSGFGLTGIGERARMMGGRHSIQSAPGQGTTVSITIGLEDGRREG